ncbi:MAG: hypothetical protein WBW62_09600 [Solirubrobacterales bacterium]
MKSLSSIARITTGGLAVLLTAGAIAACGSDNDSPADDTTQGQSGQGKAVESGTTAPESATDERPGAPDDSISERPGGPGAQNPDQ